MASNAPAFIASTNINPSTAVKIDVTAGNNYHVVPCAAATDSVIGIAQEGTYYAPGVAGADGYAAHAEQELTVWGEGEQCLWTVGANPVTQGDYLTSDANGNAVTIAFTTGAGKIFHGAVALESGLSGQLIRVLVKVGVLPGITA